MSSSLSPTSTGFKVQFAASAPSPQWALFPEVGVEGARPLSFARARAVGGGGALGAMAMLMMTSASRGNTSGVGKCGQHLNNNAFGCNYGVGQTEATAGKGAYDRLYMNVSSSTSPPVVWRRITSSSSSLVPPPDALPIEGLAGTFLVRAVLPNGDMHPGVWEAGAGLGPSFAYGGVNRYYSVGDTNTTSSAVMGAAFDVLCLNTSPTTASGASKTGANNDGSRLAFAAIPPSPQWRLFPSSGFERNAPLHFGYIHSIQQVGKYGPGLSNFCNYCSGAKEHSMGPEKGYHKLYYLPADDADAAGSSPSASPSSSPPMPRHYEWVRATQRDLSNLSPPASIGGGSGAAKVGGLPPSTFLVRIVLDRGAAVHPGAWPAGEAPFYAWGGAKQVVTTSTDPAKAYVEVLCYRPAADEDDDDDEGDRVLSSAVGFRPREVAAAFSAAYSGADAPFGSLEDLMAWKGGHQYHRSEGVEGDSSFSLPSVGPIRTALTIPLLATASRPGPKVIVCHDFKGGYHDCDYNYFRMGAPRGEGEVGKSNHLASASASATAYADKVLADAYTFQYWHVVDTFIYFSHAFVTPPTVEWINVCHRNGTKCLGTIITEHQQGVADCQAMLKDAGAINAVCTQLALLAKVSGFEGYLINIENPIHFLFGFNLQLFVATLTQKLKEAIPNGNGTVIWYDAVTVSGNVQYQNAVTDANFPFMKQCDGIFTNYWWDPARLEGTERVLRSHGAADRLEDVYCGIDVFGRNTYLGGGFNTKSAVKAILKARQSIAIFAPGWSKEGAPSSTAAGGGHLASHNTFLANDGKLWEEMSILIRSAKASGSSSGSVAASPHPLIAAIPSAVAASHRHNPIATLFGESSCGGPTAACASLSSSVPLFASSLSQACGVDYLVEGSSIGALSDPAPLKTTTTPTATTNYYKSAAAPTPWCQQTAMEPPFAFIGGDDGSCDGADRELLVLVEASSSSSSSSSSSVHQPLAVSQLQHTKARLNTINTTHSVSMMNAAGAAGTAILQGTHSLTLHRPRTVVAPSSGWVLLVHGRRGITTAKKMPTDCGLAMAVVVTTLCNSGRVVPSSPLHFKLYLLTSDGAVVAAAPTNVTSTLIGGARDTEADSEVSVSADADAARWCSHHASFGLPQSTVAVVGFAAAFEGDGDGDGGNAVMSDTVTIGRVVMGSPQQQAVAPSSSHSHSHSPLPCCDFPTLPLSVDIRGVKRFSGGRAAVLVAVERVGAIVSHDAAKDAPHLSPHAFAVELCFRYPSVVPDASSAAKEPSFRMVTQHAFGGVHYLPQQQQQLLSPPSHGGVGSHPYVLALPIDDLSEEFFTAAATMRRTKKPSGDANAADAQTAGAFIEVTLVPELSPMPSVGGGGCSTAGDEGYLNTRLATSVAARIH